MQGYELFDLESGNLKGSYASLDDAYQVVREVFAITANARREN